MTESSRTPRPLDKVRITASYPTVHAGDVTLPGHPETVEIELNDDAVPAGSAERVAFIQSLIDSLFRGETPAGNPNPLTVTVNRTESEQDRVRRIGDAARRGVTAR
jgi:hypothetical protein